MMPFAWGIHDRCDAICNAPCADTYESETKFGLVPYTRSGLKVWCPLYLDGYRKDPNASMNTLLVRLCGYFLHASNP